MSADSDHDDRQGGATALPDVEALRTLSETQFRTVTASAGRHGMRLEQTYWKALDNIAVASGMKRNAYIGHIVERAHEGGLNASSAVRSVVTDHLLSQNERLAPLANASRLLTMLQMAPSPSFALDRSKRIVKVNFEFMRYLRSVAGSTTGSVPVDTAQLTLDRPTEQIFAEVEPGTSIECGVAIRVDNRERRSTARILVVPPGPASVLVGYLLV